MKRLFSIFALAALMLLGIIGDAFAYTIDVDLSSVGAETYTRIKEYNYTTVVGGAKVKVTAMPTSSKFGEMTIVSYYLDKSESEFQIASYIEDKNGRKFIITKIGNNAFKNSDFITRVYLDVENKVADTDFISGKYRFEIGDYAFSGCTKLESLTMSYNIQSARYALAIVTHKVGQYAFENCSSLNRTPICQTAGQIQAYAFKNCTSMFLAYASGSIDETAFTGCTGVTTIYWHGGFTKTLSYSSESPMYPMRKNVTTVRIYGAVPAHFFEDFTALTDVKSPANFFDSMTNTNIYQMKLGDHAFGWCTNLQSAQVAGEIDPNAFYNCKKLTSVTYRGGFLANSQIPTDESGSFFYSVKDYVTTFTIEETSTNNIPNAFVPSYLCYGMKNLAKVTIPDYVRSIGSHAFAECTSLATVSFNKETSTCMLIGEKAFYDCSSLSSIYMPVSMEYIYSEAFEWCQKLENCPISSANTNLKMIGKEAFYQTALTSFYVPASVTSLGGCLLGGDVFQCSTIHYMPKNLVRDKVGGCYADLFVQNVSYHSKERNKVTRFYINSETTYLPDSLFFGYKGLVEVLNSNGSAYLNQVYEVGKSVFQNCESMWTSGGWTQLQSVTEVGERAFEGSGFCGSIDLSSLKKIGERAFANTKLMYMYDMGELGSLTEIGKQAFADNSKLSEITLPVKVTKVGDEAFKNCPKVEKLNFNAKKLEQSDPLGETIRGQLTTINIGSAVELIPEELARASKVEKLTIPSNVRAIGQRSFFKCNQLDSVIVASDLVESAIPNAANAPFVECEKLKKVIFKSGVASVPNCLFAEANNIEKLDLGTVSAIGDFAFCDCSHLPELVLNNVKSIGEKAFSYPMALKTIRINQSVPSIYSNSFDGANVETIYASCTVIDALKADVIWNAVCSNIVGSDNEYKYPSNMDDFWSTRTTLEIVEPLDCEGVFTVRAVPEEGATFMYWDDGSTDNPRTIDMKEYNSSWLYAISATDEDFRQTNFSVTPEGAGYLMITNQYGHKRLNQKFINSRETAKLTPMESNGWYQFDHWDIAEIEGGEMPYLCDYEGDPNTLCVMINYMMDAGGMGEMCWDEFGNPMPCGGPEPEERAMFDENLKAVFVPKQVPVTVEFCTAENGSLDVAEGVNQKVGATITLTATPKEGFLFDKWADGNTDNPRTLTVEPKLLKEWAIVGYDLELDQMIYEESMVWEEALGAIKNYNDASTYSLEVCASFIADPNYKKKYTITVESNDAAKGSVEGGGVYEEGSEATLTAIPNVGFDFVQWSDEVTENPRKVTVTGDATFMAMFTEHINYFDVKTAAEPAEGGIVIGGGNFQEGQEIELEATANSGYEFTQWKDGFKEAKRVVKVTKDETFVAQFTKLEVFFTLTVVASPEEGGVVTGGGNYKEGAVATLTALANEGFEFVRWTDGVLQATREVTVTADATYTAEFKVKEVKPKFTITVTSENEEMGTVEGGGTFEQGEVISIKALPKDGYNFLEWSDGNKNNPRQVAVVKDETFTAKFVKAEEEQKYFTITVISANPTMGSVIGGNTYLEGSVIQIAAIPNAGYQFSMWNDENTDNPRQITVTKDEIFVASFVEISASSFTITVETADPEMGSVFGGGVYNEGQTATIAAVANEGFEFVQWSDGNTDNPRVVTVTKNETFVAQFKKKESAVEDLNGSNAQPARKVMIDGVIYIIKGDKRYNVLGAEVK